VIIGDYDSCVVVQEKNQDRIARRVRFSVMSGNQLSTAQTFYLRRSDLAEKGIKVIAFGIGSGMKSNMHLSVRFNLFISIQSKIFNELDIG